MKRRDFVGASVAGMAGLFSSAAWAQKGHEHHGHSADGGKVSGREVSPALKELQDSTFECLKAGEICLAACNVVLASGKTSMADCQIAVLNMLSVVEAMAETATYNTADPKLLKGLAKVCGDFCRKCEKECKPHAEHHPECQACMDACIRCAKACEGFVRV